MCFNRHRHPIFTGHQLLDESHLPNNINISWAFKFGSQPASLAEFKVEEVLRIASQPLDQSKVLSAARLPLLLPS